MIILSTGLFDTKSFRLNYPLIPHKLGIFVAGLNDDREYERKPSYNRTERGYLAFIWEPDKKTMISGNFEHYQAKSRIPNTTTPQDGMVPTSP